MLDTAVARLPAWQCHKVVRADRIAEAVTNGPGGALTILKLDGGESFAVDTTWMLRHNASVGGYLVIYEDGYQSFSPAAAFEGGYTRIAQGAAG